MEVHHHPELPHSENKHLKEYILEFLMIFLAVTMGFIAESIREHLSDSSKEKEYITGLIKDLKVDTTNLNFTISRGRLQLKGIDTLRNIPKNKLSEIKVQDSLFMYTTEYLFALNPFKSDDITMIQLRNAGGYRLIRKEGAVDSIALYESKNNMIDIQQSFLSAGVNKALDAANVVFDFNAFGKFRFLVRDVSHDSTRYPDLPLSPFVQRVWIALELKGLAYQYIEVDPYKKPQALLDVNPRGLVPAIRHGDWGCGESTVLMEYVSQQALFRSQLS